MVWGKAPVPYEIPESLDFVLFTWLAWAIPLTGFSWFWHPWESWWPSTG